MRKRSGEKILNTQKQARQNPGGPEPAAPIIRIRDLVFRRGNKTILDGISLDIQRGSIVALMGPSGAGKTTLLQLISGQLQPDEGSVEVNGRQVSAMSDRELFRFRRHIGVLLQNGALFTDLTVYENIATPVREHTDLPEPLIRRLVMTKLNTVGLGGTEELMPYELSGGMARRVALARAIALDPMLIMYDEPFAGLDPISLGVIGNLIRRLNDALGATSIVVTHDVQESLKMVDYVYYLSDGQIVARGAPKEMQASVEPLVHQFVYGEPDGPVPFQYPSAEYRDDLMLNR